MQKWWLSYADTYGFKGAVVVEADTFEDAAARSRDVGASPGGKVYGFPFPRDPDDADVKALEALPVDTLLSIDGLRELGIRRMNPDTDRQMEVADA